MHVIMCQERFVPLIKSGNKNQTIRLMRKRVIACGDKLSLRRWTGLPYRSKQEEIKKAEVDRVLFVWFGPEHVQLGKKHLSLRRRDRFAADDGFSSFKEMLRWFLDTYGTLDFFGIVIYWK